MTQRRQARALLGALVSALVATGLLVAPATAGATTAKAASAAARQHSASATRHHHAAAATQRCGAPRRLVTSTFPRPVRVTNQFFPLEPGMHWVTSGTVSGSSHHISTTVTDLTKVINGVQTIVVLDEDFDGNQLSEAELAFFAQDRAGTVWGLGEYPEEYDNGVFSGAPSVWLSGLQGAHAGIAMLAHPTVGTAAYLQGLSLAVQFEDCARVFATGQSTCVPTGCYHNVLVTDEWGPLDPAGGHQRKFYAPGVGVVRVGAVDGTDPEVLRLTTVSHLCPAALTSARNTALRLDRHGYTVSPKVYGRTAHAHETLHAPAC